MSNYSSQKKRVIVLALFHRYAYTILFPLLIIFIFAKNTMFLLFGVNFILFALHSLIGYVCRWKHIYCSYQNAYKEKMTPNNICWAKIRKVDAYGIPLFFGALGLIMIIMWFI